MIVGFDVSQVGRWKAGGGYFADGLIRGLSQVDSDNEYVLYPTFGDGVWDPMWAKTRLPVNVPNFRRGPGHRHRDDLEAFWRASSIDETWLSSPDIIHSNNFYCPPRGLRARLVYTLYDLGFVDHPEWTTEENRVTCFSGVFRASLYADWIVAISEYTRQHFLHTFPHYPADRISVVHPGSRFSGDAEYPPTSRVRGLARGGFWLSVATLEPRKNHRGLLHAYALLKAQTTDVLPLVIAGGRGWLMQDFERELDDLNLRGDVVLLGYVDDATLGWLYSNCFAFVYISLFEGFGLPALEAMACGAAVITSNTTSLPEVVSDAGLQVDPCDPEAVSAALVKLSRGELDPTSLRERGRVRARSFSWVRAAREVKAIYAELDHT